MFDESFLDKLAAEIASRIRQELAAAAQPQRLLTLEDAAIYLGRSKGAVEQLIKRGSLPVTKIDGKRQIDRIELDRIIRASTHYAG